MSLNVIAQIAQVVQLSRESKWRNRRRKWKGLEKEEKARLRPGQGPQPQRAVQPSPISYKEQTYQTLTTN
jgi:hypothetical protein